MFDSVESSNGLLLIKKFEQQNSNNQLSILLSAFSDMCILLSQSNDTGSLWQSLISEFSSNMHILVSTVPDVLRLAPSPEIALALASDMDMKNVGEVNFFSLCDTIKRFMRATSISSRPVMIFLDDLQWADSVSMGLVHTVLVDQNGASGVFFVGTYRNNEVSEAHVLHGFYSWLQKFHVPLTEIYLGGITESEVNELVSESLGMLPRLCQSLSQIVFRKTKGSPLFVQSFLQSLGTFVECLICSEH